MRLQVNFRSEESDIPETEPFILEGLTRYQLNQQLLNTLVEQHDAERLFRHFRAAGSLPYGAFGEILWDAQRRNAVAGRAYYRLSPAGSEYGDRSQLQRRANHRVATAGSAGRFVALAPIFVKRFSGRATLAGTSCLLCQWWNG